MERFTKKVDGVWTASYEYGSPPYPVVAQEVIDRLAAYEDTGFTPEEVQQMRWIPVEEKLPEEEGIYIVCVDGEVKSDAYCMLEGIERWFCYDGSINALYIDPYSSKPLRGGPYPRVTHWMHLPQPPKEEKKNDQAGCTGVLPQVPGLRGGSNWRPKRGLQHRGRACGNFHGGHSHKVHKGGKMCLGCGRGVQVQKRRTTGKRRRML